MIKKNKMGKILFFLLVLFSLAAGQKKESEKDLPEKYREFLKLTTYIMLDKEKDVFLQLTNDRDRDIFIETFWKQRDPTPGTPENEYRDEIIKRFEYANKYYGRGTGREGWMTDRGKFHIILGQPSSVERFSGMLGIYPCEVWYYYGEGRKNLPPQFALVFYQKGGAGEYKLYDPVVDGPSSLVIKTSDLLDIAPEDYEQWYEKIKEIAPTLADVSISLIPGGEAAYGYQPSPRNTILLANIIQSPKQDVNPSYATHFLDYKGLVSTEYMTNYVDCEAAAAVIQDPLLRENFLHFSVAPKSLSLDYYEPKDQYFCNFTLTVSLRKPDQTPEKIIFQYSKEFAFYFSPQQIERVQANGIALEDSFPMSEGKHKLIILLQNSVGKEFSLFEKEIVIPGDIGAAEINGPFFGYNFQDYSTLIHVPWKVLDKKLVVDPKNTFSRKDIVALFFNVINVNDNLWNQARVRVSFSGMSQKGNEAKSFEMRLKDYPLNKIIAITRSIPAKDFAPDYYEVKVTLLDGQEKILDEKRGQFIISPLESIAHPIASAKGFSLDNKFLFYYMLAHQYSEVNDPASAESYYQRAYGLKPDYGRGVIEYANFLIKMRKFAQSLEIIEGVRDDSNFRFEYFLLRGNAYLGLGQFDRAIENYLEGNKIYNSDIRLLNNLGFCYYRTGQKQRALDVLKSSLKLNPDQEDAKKLLKEINKNLR